MTAVATVLRDRISTALQGTALADAAGIAPDEWAADPGDGGHVFDVDAGYIHGRNRGRVPFIEFLVSQQDQQQLSASGGTVSSSIKIIVHLGGVLLRETIELASSLLALAVSAIRAIAGHYCDRGTERYGSIKPGPWGHQFEVTLSSLHAVSR